LGCKRCKGCVLLDLGPDRHREPIGGNGQAYFPAIPASFREQAVIVSLDSDVYEPANPGQKHKLDGASLYLPVRKKAGRVAGRVQDTAKLKSTLSKKTTLTVIQILLWAIVHSR